MFSVRHVWNTLYDFSKYRHTATSDVLSTSSAAARNYAVKIKLLAENQQRELTDAKVRC